MAMLTFAVSEEKNKWLRETMESLGIFEKDVEEKFVHSALFPHQLLK